MPTILGAEEAAKEEEEDKKPENFHYSKGEIRNELLLC
jgi:hypothetical protein